ncbi:hypothetical protein [Aquimarina megaterium]|nr:hypothetical protein [Aquimarina megaterium]
MKTIQAILGNISKKISNSILQNEGYINHKDFLSSYENDENTFLFI